MPSGPKTRIRPLKGALSMPDFPLTGIARAEETGMSYILQSNPGPLHPGGTADLKHPRQKAQRKNPLPLEPCFLLNVSAILKLHTFQEITQDLIVTVTVVFMVRPAEKRA